MLRAHRLSLRQAHDHSVSLRCGDESPVRCAPSRFREDEKAGESAQAQAHAG